MNWKSQLAFRILKGRGNVFSSPGLVSVISLAFGVMALIVSLAVLTGFEKIYQKTILSFNAHLLILDDREIRLDDSVLQRLNPFFVTPDETAYWNQNKLLHEWKKYLGFKTDQKMEELSKKGIIAVTPYIFRPAFAFRGQEVIGINMKGVDAGVMKQVYPMNYTQLLPVSTDEIYVLTHKTPSLLLGKNLYEKLEPYKTPNPYQVKLLVPKPHWEESKGLKSLIDQFELAGLFESGIFEFDSTFVLTDISTMRQVFDIQDNLYTGADIRLDDPAKAFELARIIEQDLPEGFQILSWDELNGDLFSAIKLEKTLFLVIMLVIVLLASLNMMGLIVMLVIKRTHDISILNVMGASAGEVSKIFSAQGFVLSLVGSILGICASLGCLLYLSQGIALDPQIYFISSLPIEWPWVWMGILIVAALLIAVSTAKLVSYLAVKRAALEQTYR